MKTTQSINYRHQMFTITTSESYRNGSKKVSAIDFKHAYSLLTQAEKDDVICIYDEDGAQMMGWELKRISK